MVELVHPMEVNLAVSAIVDSKETHVKMVNLWIIVKFLKHFNNGK